MSSSIDERIVRLGFDNAKFESGAAKSMSTIDKLKEKLQFKGAEQGAEKLDRSIKAVDFSKMLGGIEAVEKRFSTMGVVGVNIVNKITDAVINGAKKIEQATIGQITSGGWSRAMNLANAQFQIEGLGEDWNEMQKAISYGVKDTAYGLDAAATAASSLVASGVAYKESIDGANDSLMHTSLRAISGVAAMTNSSYEDISRIFTTVAGNGRLMGDQLLQLSSRGMNVAATLGKTLGKTEAEVRDMVSRGQIDFETFATAMDDAFGAHAKEANKTFTGALSNMKAALSRFGAVFATPIIDKTNTLFISLTSRIDELKSRLGEITIPRSLDELHEKLDKLNLTAAGFDAVSKTISEKTINLGEDFAAMWQSGINAFSALIEAVDLSWFDKVVEKVDTVTNKVKFFFDTLTEYLKAASGDNTNAVEDATKTLLVSAEEAEAAKRVIEGAYGTGLKRKEALLELFKDSEDAEQHAKNVQAYVDSVVSAGWSYEKAAIKVAEANDTIADSEETVAKKEHLKRIFDQLKTSGDNVVKAAKGVVNTALSVGKAIAKGLGFDALSAGDMLVRFTNILVEISDRISQVVTPLLGSITIGVRNLWNATRNVYTSIKTILSSIFSAFTSVFKIDTKSISNGIVGTTSNIEKFSQKLLITEAGAEKIRKAFVTIFTLIRSGFSAIKKVGSYIFGFFDSIINSNLFETIKTKISTIFDYVGNFDASTITDNPLVNLLKSIIDGIGEILQSGGDIPSKLSTFVSGIVEAVSGLGIGGIAKIAAGIFVLSTIIKYLLGINKIGGMLQSIANIPNAISNFFTNAGTAIEKAGKAVSKIGMAYTIMIIAKSLVMVAGAIIALSFVNEDALYRSMAVIAIIGLVIMLLMKVSANTTSSKNNLLGAASSLVNTVKTFYSIAVMLLAISGAVLIMSAALAILEKTGAGTAQNMLTVVGILSLIILATISLTYVANKLQPRGLRSITPTLLAMTAFTVVLSISVLIMSAALLVASKIQFSSIAKIALTIGVMITAIAVLFKVLQSSSISSATILSLGATFVLIGVSLLLITTSINKLSNSINLGSVVALIAVVATIGILLAVITEIVGKNDSTTGVLAAGAAFVLVSVSLLIFVAAIEKLASASGNMLQALVIFVAFVAIISVLAALSAKFPSFANGLLSIGTAFVSIGLGSLLVGAGIALVNVGISKLVDSIVKLIPNLNTLFGVLEAHKGTIIALGIFIIAALALIVVGIVRLAAIVEPIVKMITDAITTVLQALAKFTTSTDKGVDSFSSKLSVKTKKAIVGILYGMIGALGAMTPKILKTIGTMIVKALTYLGKLVGRIAEGLVNLLIETINGVARAIRNNSNRIMNAIGNVIVALASLVLALLREVVTMIPGIGDWLGEKITDMDVAMAMWAEERTKMAAEADATKKAITDLVRGVDDEADDLTDSDSGILGGLGSIMGGFTGTSDSASSAADSIVGSMGLMSTSVGTNSEQMIGDLTGVQNMFDGLSGIDNTDSVFTETNGQLLDVVGNSEDASKALSVTAEEAEAAKKVINSGINGSERRSYLLDYFKDTQDAKEHADNVQKYINAVVAAGWDYEATGIKVVDTNSDITESLSQLVAEARGLSESSHHLLDDAEDLAASDDIFYEKFKRMNAEYEARKQLINGPSKKPTDSHQSTTKTLSQLVAEARGLNTELEEFPSNPFSFAIRETTAKGISKVADEVENLNTVVGGLNDSLQTFNTTRETATTAAANADFIGPIVDNISDGSGAVTTAVTHNIVDPITGTISTAETTTTAATTTGLTDPVVTTLSSSELETEITTAVTERITSPVKRAIWRAHDDIRANTDYMIAGLIESLKSPESNKSVTSSMGDLVSAIKNRWETDMDQHSPSKVFYRNGKYLVEGLSNGINNSTVMATTSMANLSDAIIVSFGSPLDYISKIASGELVYDPSIRPVFDGSLVRSGAQSLNSMIGSQTIQLSGYTGQLAADISQLDNSNLMVVDELRQLREDMAVMTEEITNMQMVMDTGALVGQISGPIDRSLGRNAVRKGRGN